MPFVTMGVCLNCGLTFYLTEEECVIHNKYNVYFAEKNKPYDVIRTLNDWYVHIQTHCPNCRYKQPPLHIQEELKKLNDM